MKKNAEIVGYYTTKFGELWNLSLSDLIQEAIKGVLKESRLDIQDIDAIFFANMLSGVLEGNLHMGAKIAELCEVNCPVFRIESACCSGGIAFYLAHNYLNSTKADTVLVVGAEKMTDYSPEQVVAGLASAASGEEQAAGLTFAGLYALMANSYMHTYKCTQEDYALVSVKNHYHGTLNEKAHFQKLITVADVLGSAYVANPLKVYDSSPISDGASAIILSTNQKVIKKASGGVRVLSSEVACDSISLKKRRVLHELLSTQIASNKAFNSAGIKRKDIAVAEVHDCFSCAEFFAMEDLGFFNKGKAKKHFIDKETTFGKGGRLVVNTSGGLKAAGHPVGATGVKQIGEIYLQLTSKTGDRQVKNAKYGLAHNIGGSGGTAVVTILGG